MKVVRETVTLGVKAPPKRNLVLRFMKGGGTRNDERCIDCVARRTS
jgi:hypothetical protein